MLRNFCLGVYLSLSSSPSPLFFTSSYFSIYTFNKTFFLEMEEAQNGEEILS